MKEFRTSAVFIICSSLYLTHHNQGIIITDKAMLVLSIIFQAFNIWSIVDHFFTYFSNSSDQLSIHQYIRFNQLSYNSLRLLVHFQIIALEFQYIAILFGDNWPFTCCKELNNIS